jgi:hypothetical protein
VASEQNPGIDLTCTPKGWGASLSCIVCGFIVHIKDVDFPVYTKRCSGPAVRIWMQCEAGHRFVIETDDHSGSMGMQTTRVLPDVEPYS